jgi:hypothetical protein
MMYYDLYTDAYKAAVGYSNELGVPIRVVAFDWQPLFEGEEAKGQYTTTNAECTLKEMHNARLFNARICRTVQPNTDTVEAVENYQRGL